jgi:3-hydroxybutyryl-CoA dehydrogenase
VPEEAPPPAYDGRPVWISPVEKDGFRALGEIVGKIGAPLDRGDKPGKDSLILVTPIGEDVTTTALAQGLDPARTLGVDTLVGLKTRRTVMTNPATKAEFRAAAHGLMTQDGVKATVIRDCPGFVGQRVISMICNIGCQIAQFGTAAPEDIDKAVVLGLNYPNGPLTFGEVLGPRNILRILDALICFYGDPRYRASPWLRRRASLGLSLFAKEI